MRRIEKRAVEEWTCRARTVAWYSLSRYALAPWLHTVHNAQFLQVLVQPWLPDHDRVKCLHQPLLKAGLLAIG